MRRTQINSVMEFARRRRTFFIVAIPLLLWASAKPDWRSFGMGLGFVFVGQAIRIWASGYIHKDQAVATGGPYAFMRNPLYLGSFVICLGIALWTNRWWAWPVTGFEFVFFYYLAILSEERFLAPRLGETYAEYCAAVPRVLPRLRPYPKSSGRFQWAQVMGNEEYRSVLPIAVLALLFILRIAMHF
ncbi:MAG TPA: isoprenylcysteine carboxylmethyltransferase family protein [Armatimonadota bacterium]